MIVSGNIQKRTRKNGIAWEITIELPRDPVTGERIRKYKSVKNVTKKEAEQVMRKMIDEIEKGYYVENSKITITEWVNTWMETYIKPNVSPTTESRYRGMINRYIINVIGHVQVQHLNTLAVQKWVNGLKISPSSGKELSASTIKHVYHVLKGAMDKAVLVGIIARNPCQGIMLPKGQKKDAVIYTEPQIRELITFAKGTEMELIIDMELCMGLRRGELLGLEWGDIDWDNNRIHIKRNRVVVDGAPVVKEPKTKNSKRTVDVPEQLMVKLKAHQKACMANRLSMGRNYIVTNYVIVHPNGQPIYPEYVSQMLTKLQKRAGLPKCRFHDLRHLCASIMLKQGISAKVAQERLGHADIQTTLNIYSHVLPSSAKDAAEKIGEMVFAV